MIEVDWTMLTAHLKPKAVRRSLGSIVITKHRLLQMNEALSARRRGGGNDEYYEYSPLGIVYDSYFTQPVQYDREQKVNYAQTGHPGVVVDPPRSANCPAYLPYQSQAPALMDLDLLSAENYQEGPYNQRFSEQQNSGSVQMYGGFLASTTHETKAPSSPTSMTNRRSSKKGTPKGVSADETATRQRGRPRLDNRDQTASEVCLLNPRRAYKTNL